MSPNVDQSDHRAGEPPDRFHPRYNSFRSWLDAEAPPETAQKLRNRPKHRRGKNNNTPASLKYYVPTVCQVCHETIDARDVVDHLRDEHPVTV